MTWWIWLLIGIAAVLLIASLIWLFLFIKAMREGMKIFGGIVKVIAETVDRRLS